MRTPEDFAGPVNIGSTGEFSIRELAEKVIQLTDSSSSIVYHDLPSDDPVQRRPDTTLARHHLEWEASTSLDVGLRRTIDYFKESYDL